MADENIFRKMMDSIGVDMVFQTQDEIINFKGVLQPVRYKNKMYLNGIPTELGYDSLKKYLLICPHTIELDLIDGNRTKLLFQEKSYRIHYYETIYFKGEAVYNWAIVHKESAAI